MLRQTRFHNQRKIALQEGPWFTEMERGQHLHEPLMDWEGPGGGRVPEKRGGAFFIPVEDEPPDEIYREVEYRSFSISHQSFMPDCVVFFFNVQKGYVSFLLLTSQVMNYFL